MPVLMSGIYLSPVPHWKYAVRHRLRDDERGSLPIKRSNWFALTSPPSEPRWREFVSSLDPAHRTLREAIASFPPERLFKFVNEGKVRHSRLIQGITTRDIQHAGQMQLLKRFALNPSYAAHGQMLRLGMMQFLHQETPSVKADRRYSPGQIKF